MLFFFFLLCLQPTFVSAFVDASFARRITRFLPKDFFTREDRMEKRGQDRDPVEAFSINEYADARIKRVCSAKLDVDSFHERRVSAVLFIFRCCWRI